MGAEIMIDTVDNGNCALKKRFLKDFQWGSRLFRRNAE